MTQQEAIEKARQIQCKAILEVSPDDWRPCWIEHNQLGMTKALWMKPNGQFTQYYKTIQSKRLHKKVTRFES